MNAKMVIVALLGMLVAGSAFPADAQSTNGSEGPPSNGVVPDEIVVGFQDVVPADVASWAADLGGEVLMVEPTLSWVSIALDSEEEATQALDAALDREDVRWAQRDGYVSTMHTPNDPLYGNQWGFPAISAPEAWDVETGSHDVVVAILDTGVEGDHPDLEANVCGPHESFVPGEDPLWDGYFHGSHVAGTVAATTDNDLGVAGTSQSCLQSVKVLSQFGSGQWTWVAAGITWAADNGAHIISMSLGGADPGPLVEDAVDYAYEEQDVLVVAAAGNSGFWGCPSVGYPAAFASVIAVASLDEPGDQHSSFSSCGPEVEIAAPGAGVLSTSNNGGYTTASGTSMAAPHVSGVAALAKSVNPSASAPELRCMLTLTADDVEDSGWDEYTGWGRVNAHTMVTMAPVLAGGTLPLATPDLCGLVQGLPA